MTSDEKISMLREALLFSTHIIEAALNAQPPTKPGEIERPFCAECRRAIWMNREALAATAQPEQSEQHKWDRTGERCVKCGAKDWMGGACDGRMPEQPTPNH